MTRERLLKVGAALLFGWVFLGAGVLGAEDIPPGYPPEPPQVPPEPPAQPCFFQYLGRTQTSQGVLQEDPFDKDLLDFKKGYSTLDANFLDAKGAFFLPPGRYQVPTLEAGIDMVVGRESFLLGAETYSHGSSPFDYMRLFKLEGSSSYSQTVPVQLRVTVVLNGRIIRQFLASDTRRIKRLPLAGPCLDPAPVGFRELYSTDLMFHASEHLGAGPQEISFEFPHPGRYLVRAELVRDIGYLHDSPGELPALGVAVDVRGYVVTTRRPKLMVIPVTGEEEGHEDFQDLVSRFLVDDISHSLQYAMAVSMGPTPVGFASIPSLSGGGFNDLELTGMLSFSKRYSSPLGQIDRFIVIVEEDEYEQLAPGPFGWLGSTANGHHYTMAKSVAFVRGPKLVRNSLGYIAPFLPKQELIASTAMHELHHSFDAWSPEPGGMGDCEVSPYHNVPLNWPAGGVASGIDMESVTRNVFMGGRDLMQPSGEGFRRVPGQCTYRHSLEFLSKPKIDPPVVMVSGNLSGTLFDPQVELAPIYQMDGFNELPQSGDGSWKIVLRDEFGQILASHPFRPSFSVEGIHLDEMYFNYTVDEPPGLARVEITAPRYRFGLPPEDIVLAARDFSDHAPTVTGWVSPFGLDWWVQWQGVDLDGDSLLYTVLTSEDGEVFLPTEVYESTRTGFLLPSTSGNLSKVKIIATDGSRSAEMVLDL